ncbi:hypothetical protein HMPREF9065_01074 [Aggregatibacter sp. oral taxon 458 str. W10330]|uniref:DUF7683 domain-containing protein n=1 Tax=Aggregatibacter sp. oral taxon 458 TaxID=712148 RepID=UPI000397A585|nr:hypothetical protein [Aggregatibacter sp. oral taxon 458]ERH27744.1 hypothetical protein HMPREF9065_01074 [Aggregatibacter sp. oral taxon 458 str. W10330]
MKKLRRYIEIYSNVTDELLVRIEVKIDKNQINKYITCDLDDPDVLGVYSLNNKELECFRIINCDNGSISFFYYLRGVILTKI